jgi:hypothetical protein
MLEEESISFKKGDVVHIDSSKIFMGWYHEHAMRITSPHRKHKNCYNVYVIPLKKYNYYHKAYLKLDVAETRKRKIKKIIN